jgi:hypothetical protein
MDQLLTIGNRWADLVRDAYESLGHRDVEPFAGLLVEDAEWRGIRSGWLRRRCVCTGREAICAALCILVEKGNLHPGNWRVPSVVQSNSLIAVTFSWRTPAHTTIDHAHILRTNGEWVVEIEDYARPRQALRIIEQASRSYASRAG